MDNGQLEPAVGHLKRSETMAKELGDDALVYEANMALGRLNLAARCHSLMAQHYKAALSVAHQMGSNTRTALTLNSLMRAFLQFGQADSAYQYAEQAATNHQNMEPAVQAELLASMGTIKMRKHERSEGQAMLEQALKLFPSSFSALQLGNSLAADGVTLKACDLFSRTDAAPDHGYAERVVKMRCRAFLSEFHGAPLLCSAVDYTKRRSTCQSVRPFAFRPFLLVRYSLRAYNNILMEMHIRNSF